MTALGKADSSSEINHSVISSYIEKPIYANMLKETILSLVNDSVDELPRPQKCAITGPIRQTILVAEDYPQNQEIITEILENLGCTVMLADNGEDALEMLKQQPDTFDMVFMDCQMPEMDGYEATREIRSDPLLKDIVVVAMTANAMSGDDTRCIEAGMDDYVSKPITIDRVVSVLKKYQKKRQSQS